MQCVQVLEDGSIQVIASADGTTCGTGLYLVQAADNAWAALLLDPSPWAHEITMAFGVGITTPLLGYAIGWAFGVVLSMFRN